MPTKLSKGAREIRRKYLTVGVSPFHPDPGVTHCAILRVGNQGFSFGHGSRKTCTWYVKMMAHALDAMVNEINETKGN